MLEDKGVGDGNLSANLLIHGSDVCLVDSHAFLGQRRGIVDGNVVQLRVGCPVLI